MRDASVNENALASGAALYASDRDRLGVAGLLVSDSHGEVFAVSHVGVGIAGSPRISVGGHVVSLKPQVFEASSDLRDAVGHPSISRLVAFFRVDQSVLVDPAIPGAREAAEAEHPVDALGETLDLVIGDSASQWRIVAIGGRASFLSVSGDRRDYGDVIECEPVGPLASPPAAAGAVLFTQGGAPVGMLVGWRGTIGLFAPLRTVLWNAELEPLTAETAAQHNSWLVKRYAADAPEMALSRAELRAIGLSRTARGARLRFSRTPSFRFAVLPLRTPPDETRLIGLEVLKEELRAAAPRQSKKGYSSSLDKWLSNALRRRDASGSIDDLRAAFAPLFLGNPDRPAREVMAALQQVHSSKREQAVHFALDRLSRRPRPNKGRERTLLWWLIHEFLIRPGSPLNFDLENDIFRRLAFSLTPAIQALKQAPDSEDLRDEIYAMAEVAMAMASSERRDGLMRTAAKRFENEPRWGSYFATRLLLQKLRERKSGLVAVIKHNRELVGMVRGHERAQAHGDDLASPLDQLVGLVVRQGEAADELPQVLLALSGLPAAPPPPSFEAMTKEIEAFQAKVAELLP